MTDDETTGLHRFLVNANKYVTSLTATLVVRRAIETLSHFDSNLEGKPRLD